MAEGILAVTCCSWTKAGAPFVQPRAPSERYDDLILTYSQRRGLNPRLVKAIMATESQFYPKAVSPVGARGLMQLMPATALEVGVAPARLHDPEPNIDAGTAYLRRLTRAARARYGVPRGAPTPRWLERRVVAAYHGGPRNIGRPLWAPSTQLYVRDVFKQARSRTSRLRLARRGDFSKS
jgi:soluble lytic murein transglycosylase-like protein